MEDSEMVAGVNCKRTGYFSFMIIKLRFLAPREIINAEGTCLERFTKQGNCSCIIPFLKGCLPFIFNPGIDCPKVDAISSTAPSYIILNILKLIISDLHIAEESGKISIVV